MTSTSRRRASALSALEPDDAFITLLIAVMDASGHVSAAEAARAQSEGRLLRALAAGLGLKKRFADGILRVIRIKNGASLSSD